MNDRLIKISILLAGLGLFCLAMFGCSSNDEVINVVQEGYAYFLGSGTPANVEGFDIDPSSGDLTSMTSSTIPWWASTPTVTDFKVWPQGGLLALENSMEQIAYVPLNPATGALGTVLTSTTLGWSTDRPQRLEVDGNVVAIVGGSFGFVDVSYPMNIGHDIEFRTVGAAGLGGVHAINQLAVAGYAVESHSAVFEGGFFAIGSVKESATPGGGVLWARIQSSDASVTSTGFVEILESAVPTAVWVRDLAMTNTRILAAYRTDSQLGLAIVDRSAATPSLLGTVELAVADHIFCEDMIVSGTRAWIGSDDKAGTVTVHMVDFADGANPTATPAAVLATSEEVQLSFMVGSKAVLVGQTYAPLGTPIPWMRSYVVDGTTGAWTSPSQLNFTSLSSRGRAVDEGRLQIVCDGSSLQFQAAVVDANTGAFDDKDVIPLNVSGSGGVLGAIFLKP